MEKPVVVNPVIDKILPDERKVNFYQLTLGGNSQEMSS